MTRYGYLDMPDGYSDVNPARTTAHCVDCNRLIEATAEDTWIDDGRKVTWCGCSELYAYRAELAAEAMYIGE